MYQSVATITQLTQLQHKTHLAKNKQNKNVKYIKVNTKSQFCSWFREGESLKKNVAKSITSQCKTKHDTFSHSSLLKKLHNNRHLILLFHFYIDFEFSRKYL